MKDQLLKTPIGRLRVIGMAEGISLLLLLLIAMPVKYVLHIPEPVKITGWFHGILFILYLLAVLNVTISNRWSFLKIATAVAASLIPFGPFLLDSRLKREDHTNEL